MFVMVNELVEVGGVQGGELVGRRKVPYIVVVLGERDAIGKVVWCVFCECFSSLRVVLCSLNVVLFGRFLAGGRDVAHGELLSYLFFDGEFADALIELGCLDVCCWLD